MATLRGTFSEQIDQFKKSSMASLSQGYRTAVMQLYVDIVDGTPRDTGTLKNNWWFGKTVGGETNPKADYPVGAEVNMIVRATEEARQVYLYDTVFIYNPLPYAEAIEKGLGPGVRKAWRMVGNAIALSRGKLKVDRL
jgi:hypothetical protein